ncbi:MAG: hypothetical protein ACM3NQ_19380 [Bacteroidales bacterium]
MRVPVPRVAAIAAAVALLAMALWFVPSRPAYAHSGSTAAQAAKAPAPPAKQTPKAKKTAVEKHAEPWPDGATIAARRADAEARRLFQSTDTLHVTLTADFGAVNGDRNRTSTKTFPASLAVAGDNGTQLSIPVTLKTRGKIRLDPRVCAFAPLSVTFTKKDAKSTPFDGQRTLKLVAHCQNSDIYDQFIVKEYLAYRLFNLVTPRSFRARLARVEYVNAKNAKPMFTRYAVFVEDDDDVARRLEGRVLEFPHTAFENYDQDALTTMMVFQYMIGNTDFSLWALHNAKMVQTRYRPLYPIVWDFDASGIVFPPYVMPDPSLQLSSFEDRKYRGPCRTLEAFEPTFALFRAKRAESLALLDAQPELSESHRKQAKRFLEQFYATLERKDALKKEFVDKCNPKNNTM